MKNFRFSLDGVLNWKRLQEEEALKAMGIALRRRQEALEALQNVRRHFGALLDTLRQARAGRMESWQQVAYTREIGRQESLCKHHEEMLEKARIEEEKARNIYLQRRREAETLQKLKEKRQVLHQKETNRALELELEEIMLSRGGKLLCS